MADVCFKCCVHIYWIYREGMAWPDGYLTPSFTSFSMLAVLSNHEKHFLPPAPNKYYNENNMPVSLHQVYWWKKSLKLWWKLSLKLDQTILGSFVKHFQAENETILPSRNQFAKKEFKKTFLNLASYGSIAKVKKTLFC